MHSISAPEHSELPAATPALSSEDSVSTTLASGDTLPPPRLIMVPGGTSIGAVALAHAGIHKIVELHEERLADPHHPAPHTVTILRDPRQVPASTLRTAALSPDEAFPPENFPELAPHIHDPQLFDGVDLVVGTSGSTGQPRWVGLSIEALLASAQATHAALSGPGRWIVAMPVHHIGGAMTLLRAVAAGFPPQIVDTSTGFDPARLIPAVRGATQDPKVPGYLSLVPTQLRALLDHEEARSAVASLAAVLVGGASCPPQLLERAHAAGIPVVRTYGMTETCGGCVYDGVPLPGYGVELTDSGRLSITGPSILTRYLDEGVAVDHRNEAFVTSDLGTVDGSSGTVSVWGRADDVIISGGLNVSAGHVETAVADLPGIVDCVVAASPDEKWGQLVTAVVTVTADSAGIAAKLRDHVGSVLGREHAPRRVLVVDHLPTLASGKIDRQAVKNFLLQTSDDRHRNDRTSAAGRKTSDHSATTFATPDAPDRSSVFPSTIVESQPESAPTVTSENNVPGFTIIEEWVR